MRMIPAAARPTPATSTYTAFHDGLSFTVPAITQTFRGECQINGSPDEPNAAFENPMGFLSLAKLRPANAADTMIATINVGSFTDGPRARPGGWLAGHELAPAHPVSPPSSSSRCRPYGIARTVPVKCLVTVPKLPTSLGPSPPRIQSSTNPAHTGPSTLPYTMLKLPALFAALVRITEILGRAWANQNHPPSARPPLSGGHGKGQVLVMGDIDKKRT